MSFCVDNQVRIARGEVMAANDAAIEMRQAAKKKEEEEVESILAYQAMKVSFLRTIYAVNYFACTKVFPWPWFRRPSMLRNGKKSAIDRLSIPLSVHDRALGRLLTLLVRLTYTSVFLDLPPRIVISEYGFPRVLRIVFVCTWVSSTSARPPLHNCAFSRGGYFL